MILLRKYFDWKFTARNANNEGQIAQIHLVFVRGSWWTHYKIGILPKSSDGLRAERDTRRYKTSNRGIIIGRFVNSQQH